MNTIKNSEYIKDKSGFDTTFIKHFPSTIETKLFLTVINNSPETNKVSFYLFEFGVSVKTLDSLSQIGKLMSQVSYNWKDSCLFIVHPNETIDPFDEESTDKNDGHIDCVTKKTPIPNFINLKSPNSKHGISMDSTFNIFVLESKAGKCFQYNMIPLKSMPRTWENGFSRGFALSKENGVVIYWMIIW
jgi:hypothetical protein